MKFTQLSNGFQISESGRYKIALQGHLFVAYGPRIDGQPGSSQIGVFRTLDQAVSECDADLRDSDIINAGAEHA